jgi:hypothetical protein
VTWPADGEEPGESPGELCIEQKSINGLSDGGIHKHATKKIGQLKSRNKEQMGAARDETTGTARKK